MGVRSHWRLLSELGLFIKHNKRWWLAPIIVAIVLLGLLIVLAQTTPLFPLVYTLY